MGRYDRREAIPTGSIHIDRAQNAWSKERSTMRRDTILIKSSKMFAKHDESRKYTNKPKKKLDCVRIFRYWSHPWDDECQALWSWVVKILRSTFLHTTIIRLELTFTRVDAQLQLRL
jgi:hypothetical protein